MPNITLTLEWFTSVAIMDPGTGRHCPFDVISPDEPEVGHGATFGSDSGKESYVTPVAAHYLCFALLSWHS
jgi:hypothetical protein